MNHTDAIDHAKFLNDILVDQCRNELAKRIKETLVKEFEEEIEKEIESFLKPLTLESVEHFKDAMKQSDKYFVHFKYGDSVPETLR